VIEKRGFNFFLFFLIFYPNTLQLAAGIRQAILYQDEP